MDYTTVHEIFDPAEIPPLETLFKKENFEFRIIKAGSNDSMVQGWKLQVAEAQREKAVSLLFDAGFKRRSSMMTADKPKSRFWIFLVLTIILIILVGILVSWWMN